MRRERNQRVCRDTEPHPNPPLRKGRELCCRLMAKEAAKGRLAPPYEGGVGEVESANSFARYEIEIPCITHWWERKDGPASRNRHFFVYRHRGKHQTLGTASRTDAYCARSP